MSNIVMIFTKTYEVGQGVNTTPRQRDYMMHFLSCRLATWMFTHVAAPIHCSLPQIPPGILHLKSRVGGIGRTLNASSTHAIASRSSSAIPHYSSASNSSSDSSPVSSVDSSEPTEGSSSTSDSISSPEAPSVSSFDSTDSVSTSSAS